MLLIAAAACSSSGDNSAADAAISPPHDGAIVQPDGTLVTADAKLTAPDGNVMPPGLRVFVTSLRYSADLRSAGGQATGRASADKICQTLADAAGIGGTFRAWLSTTDRDAIEHVLGNGPWYRMDGALAFPNRASLGTTPMVPISVDEKLGMPDPFYEAWTGTALGGYIAPLGSRQSVTCWDWTSTVDSEQVGGGLGDIDASGAVWTDFGIGHCSPFRRRLYCFEQ